MQRCATFVPQAPSMKSSTRVVRRRFSPVSLFLPMAAPAGVVLAAATISPAAGDRRPGGNSKYPARVCPASEECASNKDAMVASSFESNIPARIKRWFDRTPNSVLGILAINTAVLFMWRLPAYNLPISEHFMLLNFSTTWHGVFNRWRIHSLLTSVFSHKGTLHYAFNMYALTSFAPLVVDLVGEKEFLQFYCGTGVLASLACLSMTRVGGLIANKPDVIFNSSLGASGAIFGIATVWVNIFPKQLLTFLFFPFKPFEARQLFPGIVFFDTVMAIAQLLGVPSFIGHSAHLMGVLCGQKYFDEHLTKYNERVKWYLRHRRGDIGELRYWWPFNGVSRW